MNKIVISAGEPSGDRLGAELIRALRRAGWRGEVSGMGGPRMRAEGMRLVASQEDVAVSGFGAVLPALPRLLRARTALRNELRRASASSCFIAIDAPDFHTSLLKFARSRALPAGWLAPPQAWAWRARRADKIAKNALPIALLFPFEQRWFAARGCDAFLVGHPLAEGGTRRSPGAGEVESFVEVGESGVREVERGERARRGGSLLLLPGSRSAQWPAQLKWQLGVWRALRADAPDDRWNHAIVSAAQPQQIEPLRRLLHRLAPGEPIEVLSGMEEAIPRASVALSLPGTVTLELALAGVPLAVGMSMGPLAWQIARRMVKLPMVSLPNLLLGEEWVSETIFSAWNAPSAEQIASEALACWKRQEVRREEVALRLRKEVGDGYSERIVKWLNEVSDGLL